MECHTISETSNHDRSASLEDDGSNKLFEINSNTPLFFSAGPGDSSVEPEETDSEDDYDDVKNEKSQVGTTGEEFIYRGYFFSHSFKFKWVLYFF